jgi:hypothetical protein
MSVDPLVEHQPHLSTLPTLASLPFSVVLVPRQSWLPVYDTCQIVNRMTGEMAALVAERALHRRDRRRTMWHIRQIAMYVCHVALQIPMTDIAGAFGRDRTTVAYSIRIVEDRRDDKAYDAFVEAIERVARSVFSALEGCGDA